MATKKEREEMRKSLSKVDNKWEMISFIWAYRRKEFLFYLAMIQSSIILFLLLKYTGIVKFILSFFGGGGEPQ